MISIIRAMGSRRISLNRICEYHLSSLNGARAEERETAENAGLLVLHMYMKSRCTWVIEPMARSISC